MLISWAYLTTTYQHDVIHAVRFGGEILNLVQIKTMAAKSGIFGY
jgi:hypothetical protein